MNRPTIDELKQWLIGPLGETFGNRFEKPEVLYQAKQVMDGVTVFRLRGIGEQSDAVVLCSAPISPDSVQQSMVRAHNAKGYLGSSTRILDPISQGRIHGLSFAVLPYCCNIINKSRLVRRVQCELLRPAILGWLLHLTETTVRDIDTSAIDHCFSTPLRHLISLEPLDSSIKDAALLAIERLASGEWVPRHVLMHGDLRMGNILFRPHDRLIRRMKMADRFVVIDWGGSEIAGYAIYDLVRIAQSIRLSTSKLKREVLRHCALLKCDPVDATSYLLASLGFIAMNIEYFPMDRFLRLTQQCYATLSNIYDVSPR